MKLTPPAPFDPDTALANKLTQKDIDHTPGGCCGEDTDRGHLCQYHAGFWDGVIAGIEATR